MLTWNTLKSHISHGIACHTYKASEKSIGITSWYHIFALPILTWITNHFRPRFKKTLVSVSHTPGLILKTYPKPRVLLNLDIIKHNIGKSDKTYKFRNDIFLMVLYCEIGCGQSKYIFINSKIMKSKCIGML